MYDLIEELAARRTLDEAQLRRLITERTPQTDAYLYQKAAQTARAHYGKAIYVRGLIEFTNYCKNDCYYCGIRRSNSCVTRYRLTPEQVLSCCEAGYGLGFRTFVLQGGEDPWFTDERVVPLVAEIRRRYPDCAITLSLGERTEASYRALFAAGANRYLLRHETANPVHYAKLHPPAQRLHTRMECLRALHAIGYQVGAGMMLGAPFQTVDDLIADLRFLSEFRPEMVGMGPFIPHHQTPFAKYPAGTLEMTLFFLAVVRLMLPAALIPATTALGTIHPRGREMGVLAGANVIMPNLSPSDVREKYLLYDNKLCTGDEAAEHCASLRRRMADIGYEVVVDRGDFRPETELRQEETT